MNLRIIKIPYNITRDQIIMGLIVIIMTILLYIAYWLTT